MCDVYQSVIPMADMIASALCPVHDIKFPAIKGLSLDGSARSD